MAEVTIKGSKKAMQALAHTASMGDYRVYFTKIASLTGVDSVKISETQGALCLLDKEKAMFPDLAEMDYVTFTRISSREICDVIAYKGNMHSANALHKLR